MLSLFLKIEKEDELLLCDGCDNGTHLGCTTPLLKEVPEGDWFCATCSKKRKAPPKSTSKTSVTAKKAKK